MKLVTSAQMRALEQQAVDAGTSLDALMEAAGLAVAQEVWLSRGVVAGRRVLVLVGPGNNGGDGLVAARHLAEWDADVAVYMSGARDDEKLTLVRAGSAAVFVAADDHDYATLQEALEGAEVVIDALLGIGRARPIEGTLAEILSRVRASRERPRPPQVIAMDVPTGVDADTGRADALALRADMTITFGLGKVGLYALPGSEYAGSVQVIDIGLPKAAANDLPMDLLDAAWVRERLPARPASSNKGTFGRVLAVAGSANYPGAARLATEAAYRVGAGLVTLACPDSLRAIVAPSTPEVTYLPLGDAPALTGESSRMIVDALGAYDVLLLGPGLSQADGVQEAVASVLTQIPASVRSCVVDADGLNALARWERWHERVGASLVLTPHPGEMARLLGTSVTEIQDDRLGAATQAARTWNQIVVLKGAHTVVAAPDGRVAISPHANSLLATAGTGDVLAGAIAGLIAQGMDAFAAAACGVYLHGAAAEEIGDDLGDRGLIASDLLSALPRAIRTVREGKVSRAAPSFRGRPGLEGLAKMLGPQ
ncbi:MAG: NAD(P)H-hydrate dehydratase [Dehalococcoidia bacterium]